MENVKGNAAENLLTIELSGRIDSANAADAEAAIKELTDANAGTPVLIDAEKLDYISSAGLRVILRLRKAHPELKIVNASSDVYEVLDMTGFTEMMPVEKAYRRLSVEGCEKIGEGSNGVVYRLDPDTIIKVYRNPDSLPDIHRERELARKAFVLGIPTAIPYDVVKVGDSYGSVFELLNAKSFAKLILAEPENLDHYMDLFVDLLKKIHNTVVEPGVMPKSREVALDWIDYLKGYLPDEQYTKIRSLIEAVPDDMHMMHGDYHIKNVMMQNGEVLLIDMDTLSTGNPVFEFASIYLAYVGYDEGLDDEAIGFLGIPEKTCRLIWKKTVSRYLGTEDPEKIAELERKAMIVGYVRMLRRSLKRQKGTEEGERRIAYCRKHLDEIVPLVDSLVIDRAEV